MYHFGPQTCLADFRLSDFTTIIENWWGDSYTFQIVVMLCQSECLFQQQFVCQNKKRPNDSNVIQTQALGDDLSMFLRWKNKQNHLNLKRLRATKSTTLAIRRTWQQDKPHFFSFKGMSPSSSKSSNLLRSHQS